MLSVQDITECLKKIYIKKKRGVADRVAHPDKLEMIFMCVLQLYKLISPADSIES